MTINQQVLSMHYIQNISIIGNNSMALFLQQSHLSKTEYHLIQTDKDIRLVNDRHNVGFKIKFVASCDKKDFFANHYDSSKCYVTWGKEKSFYEFHPMMWTESEGKISARKFS